jgi:DUF1680 family protein
MPEIIPKYPAIDDPFWNSRLKINAEQAIFHQWKMLEDSHCINNFRIANGEIDGIREGWFFSDSDAYKWLDAAARIYTQKPSVKLKKLMAGFVALLERTQTKDGYLFTYNQVYFPAERWENLMIEHELYCHGHLIEACISFYRASGEGTALDIAHAAAGLLVRDFLNTTPDRTSGHEEIELALIQLHDLTGQGHYLELARQFLERRGKIHPFAALILRQNSNVNLRTQIVQQRRKAYLDENPDHEPVPLYPDNYFRKPRFAKIRWQLSALSGKFFQMHTPIRNQTIPVGHAVRFTYLETATAMLYRHTPDKALLTSLQKAWERMVTRRMYVTGGIGSLPLIEGFGNDYELDPETAYAETCAALGSLLWNWEMAQISGEACYSDLLEWQLYNAVAVGMGLGGDTYLFNNPLCSQDRITRQPWFQVPCCPSNLSRLLASLGKFIFSSQDDQLWIHQYIGCQSEIDAGTPLKISLRSGLPWEGKARIVLAMEKPVEFTLHLRIPSWVNTYTLQINGQTTPISTHLKFNPGEIPASGYDPRQAWFLPIRRCWNPGDVLDLDFDMQVTLRKASHRVHAHKGKAALTRGPIVYCLESTDNPGLDIFSSRLDPTSITSQPPGTTYSPALLGGTQVITGITPSGKEMVFIPYFLWGNRGESQMTVWINS